MVERLQMVKYKINSVFPLLTNKYAIENPQKWRGYGPEDWGLTASDGPGDVTKNIDGRQVQFRGYSARGFPNDFDDGTIAPIVFFSVVELSLATANELPLPFIQTIIQVYKLVKRVTHFSSKSSFTLL
jgi:hypothetical protein